MQITFIHLIILINSISISTLVLLKATDSETGFQQKLQYSFSSYLLLHSFPGDRDDLHEKFSSSVLDLQQKSGLKYAVLERKIVSLRTELDVRDAQLQTVLTQPSTNSDEGNCKF